MNRAARKLALSVFSFAIIAGFTSAFATSAQPDSRSAAIQAAQSPQELGLKILGEPLESSREVTPQELSEIKQALAAFSAREKRDDFQSIEQYVDTHPGSPWKVQLLNYLGTQLYTTAWFSKALTRWEQAWEAGKGETNRIEKLQADDAFGNLVRMHSRLGNVERIENLLEETKERDFTGSSLTKVGAAKEAAWMMRHEPAKSFACGPSALGRLISLKKGETYLIDPSIEDFKATEKGTSFAQVLAAADRLDGGYQLAKRQPGAAVIVPSVVHWKAGHFAALTADHSDGYIVQDTTFRDDFVISENALDQEASGYFLVPKGNLPAGWSQVSAEEGATIWGKGNVGDRDDENTCPEKGPKSCPKMAGSAINLLMASLVVKDTPLWYEAGYGPSVDLQLRYNQVDQYQPTASTILPYSNFSRNWTHDYVGFVTYDPSTSHWPATAIVYERGGGIKRYTFPAYVAPPPQDPPVDAPLRETATSIINSKDGSYLIYTPGAGSGTTYAGTFQRVFPDGSKLTYGFCDAAVGTTARTYLTIEASRQGLQLQMEWQASSSGQTYQLKRILDAAGKPTEFLYELEGSGHPDLITRVNDPFGRHASFEYDDQYRLKKITDMGGISSEFRYLGNSSKMSELITPYGITRFDMGYYQGNNTFSQWLEITDPEGAKERVEFVGSNPRGVTNVPPAELPQVGSITFSSINAQYRNTYYWNKKVMMEDPGNYEKAEIYHWLHKINQFGPASNILESYKKPLENRVFYHYVGKVSGSHVEGTNPWPTAIARIVKDENGNPVTQASLYEYDSVGNVTKETDPKGRVTKYVYDNEKQNLLKTIQVNGGADEVIWEATGFVGPGMPTTTYDAARQPTTMTWNPTFKKIATVTNAKSETVTYTYESVVGANGYGKLKTTTGDSIDATITNSYDSVGRIASVTNGDGYTLSYDYDNLDRVVRTTYPDAASPALATTEEVVYSRLDQEWTKDRLGRWTHYFYDSAQRVTAVVDPENRVTRYDWCSCGALHGLTDGNGNLTRFKQDIQFRMIEKEYADGKKVLFEYEPEIGRIKKKTDAKSQVSNYRYFVDDNLQNISYTNLSGAPLIPSTPGVSFTYEVAYDRVSSMTDGTGTTTYVYHPVTTSGQLGANQLKIEDPAISSGSSDAITFSYDQLGRVATRSVNGVAEGYSYDTRGRTSQIVNALGSFSCGYDGTSSRLAEITYPLGSNLNCGYTYYGNAGDRRLNQITYVGSGSALVAKFGQQYDSVGNVKEWKQQVGVGSAADRWNIDYDKVNQLTVANRRDDVTNAIKEQNSNKYDNVGNRLAGQVNATVSSGTFNNLNQLVGLGGGGSMLFEGTVSEASTVTVGGQPAIVDGNNVFRGYANVTSGAVNNIPIVATDANGLSQSKVAQITIPSQGARSFSYDFNGNLTSDGERTYEWDAENRLVAINYVGNTNKSVFTYDGQGRCVKITEQTQSGSSASSYLWDKTERIEERDSFGTTTIRRFFSLGFAEGTQKYFYLKDHLGSIWGLVNASGTVVERWGYDLWGKRSSVQTSGVKSRFAYTGHLLHEASGLLLTYFRAYDPSTARWLSRDPLEETEGMNLYAYVLNDPVGSNDPLGLKLWKCIHRAWDGSFLANLNGNHSYLYDDGEPDEKRRSCGRNGSSGKGNANNGGKGPSVDFCVPIPASKSQERDIMKCCRDPKQMTRGCYAPFLNDCHTSVDRCIKKAGGKPPPLPRIGPANK